MTTNAICHLSPECIVEVFDAFPRRDTSDSDFGNENVNMRMPCIMQNIKALYMNLMEKWK